MFVHRHFFHMKRAPSVFCVVFTFISNTLNGHEVSPQPTHCYVGPVLCNHDQALSLSFNLSSKKRRAGVCFSLTGSTRSGLIIWMCRVCVFFCVSWYKCFFPILVLMGQWAAGTRWVLFFWLQLVFGCMGGCGCVCVFSVALTLKWSQWSSGALFSARVLTT